MISPYDPDGRLTTPFYLNNYRAEGGTTKTVHNPTLTRQDSIEAASDTISLNCRIRVTRLAGYPHRSDFDWSAGKIPATSNG